MKVDEITSNPVHTIFYGLVDHMMTVGAGDPREHNKNHKWSVMPAGDEEWDTYGCYNRAHALEIARELANFFDVKVSRINNRTYPFDKGRAPSINKVR